ncbi:DUF1223 domain-containing protein [Shewanella sp.]|uniref:DUF1223 domain-containing protein n=1 Tax=Shewanella sp. TaxID=50422 RepID=UPI003561F3D7
MQRPILWLVSFLLPAPLWAWEFHAISQTSHPVIIELYTSQGCSSCPPAEQWLSGFTQETGLWHTFFPMAFHVSYWDYLGWKDSYAQQTFSRRQYAYWNRKHSKGVYTPQIFIDGKEWRGGELPVTKAAPRLNFSLADGVISATFDGAADVLNLAIVGVGLQTRVARGENRGRLLQHDFTVLSFFQYENCSDDPLQSQFNATLALDIDSLRRRAPRLALVVWAEANLRPLQAAGGWLTQ